MKNLIRNGGFERNTTAFWTAFDEKSFTVVATPVYKGSYAGKLVADGSDKPYIMTNDYIPLVASETAYLELFLRSTAMFEVHIIAVYYDEGLNEIDAITHEVINPGTASYVQAIMPIPGIEGGIYVRPKIYMNDSTNDRYTLIDNVLFYKFSPEESIAGNRVMMDELNITGAATEYGNWILTSPFKEGEFTLYVDACAGAAETVDVEIISRVSYGAVDLDHTIATFAQITTGGSSEVIVLTEGLGSKIRAKAVIGGAPTDVDVQVFSAFKV